MLVQWFLLVVLAVQYDAVRYAERAVFMVIAGAAEALAGHRMGDLGLGPGRRFRYGLQGVHLTMKYGSGRLLFECAVALVEAVRAK